MTLRIERYRNTRHWAVYDGDNLVVVTVYKRGAQEVRRRPRGTPRPSPGRHRPWRGVVATGTC